MIKEIIESQAYQLICSYRFRFKIGNRLSNHFDDNEGIYIDNIMSQYHLIAAKEEQNFRENILMRIVKEITSMFVFSQMNTMPSLKILMIELLMNQIILITNFLTSSIKLRLPINISLMIFTIKMDILIKRMEMHQSSNKEEFDDIFENFKYFKEKQNSTKMKLKKISSKTTNLTKDFQDNYNFVYSSIRNLTSTVADLENKNEIMKKSIEDANKSISIDSKTVKIINKGKFNFPNLKDLSIKKDYYVSEGMNCLLSNSFPSPLRSFTLSGFSFDPRELACLKKLQTVDSTVSLHNFYFSSSE